MSSPISADACRKHAKSLHRDVCAGQPEAIERIRRSHPFFRGKEDQEIKAKTTRRTAQKVIARENGFVDWETLLEATASSAPAAGSPLRPSIVYYEWQANALWGDRSQKALDRIRIAIPETAQSTKSAQCGITHDLAFKTIAKEQGFESFDALMQAVRKVAAVGTTDLEAERFLESACLQFLPHVWIGHREHESRKILAAHPDILGQSIYLAAAAGATDLVEAFLDADPSLVNARGGVRTWAPILYACYSRLNSTVPEHNTLKTVRLLLERGANPNAFYQHPLHRNRRFTALTGVMGQADSDGKHNEACNMPHAYADELAVLLLDAGADPNECQGLDHVKSLPDSKWFRLMLRYGLNKEHRLNWLGQGEADSVSTLDYFLGDAVARGMQERIRLLLDHGADPNAIGPDHVPHLQKALETGQHDIVALLRARGARDVELSGESRLKAAIMSGNGAAFDSLLTEDLHLAQTFQERKEGFLYEATAANRIAATRLLLERGADPNGNIDKRGGGNRPLHVPCWFGNLDIVKLLVEFGADIDVSSGGEGDEGNRPIDHARGYGQQAVVEYLESLSKVGGAR
jgi:ankyrin repeat protein